MAGRYILPRVDDLLGDAYILQTIYITNQVDPKKRAVNLDLFNRAHFGDPGYEDGQQSPGILKPWQANIDQFITLLDIQGEDMTDQQMKEAWETFNKIKEDFEDLVFSLTAF